MTSEKSTLVVITIIFLFSTNFAIGQSKITAIQAKLFYNENKAEKDSKDVSGTFSENIIDNKDFALWNTIIGAGSADGYSNQSIVIVEVSSNGLSNKQQMLHLIVESKKKDLLNQSQSFSCIENKAKYKLLFLLNNTGCEKLVIKAELFVDKKMLSAMSKSIDFECGE